MIRRAVDEVRRGAGPDTINAVVVMTDGNNENPEDDDLDGLIRELDQQALEDGVRVFTIAYGQDADLETARRLSEASRAAAYDATDPLTIDSVFTNVLSNFGRAPHRGAPEYSSRPATPGWQCFPRSVAGSCGHWTCRCHRCSRAPPCCG